MLTTGYGVGINTGEAIVGNIGTPELMNYTAIGDAVNIAARLQAEAQVGDVLISDSTTNGSGPFRGRGAGTTTVRATESTRTCLPGHWNSMMPRIVMMALFPAVDPMSGYGQRTRKERSIYRQEVRRLRSRARASLSGQRIQDYIIEDEVGRGGMARV
ncbi:MAG: adenylate/guanylate cyclase domain-containing protein [Thermomicrobiales bacterium]